MDSTDPYPAARRRSPIAGSGRLGGIRAPLCVEGDDETAETVARDVLDFGYLVDDLVGLMRH
nr:hypothetical protein Itr_chr14CG21250 [Ipomoea trifida]